MQFHLCSNTETLTLRGHDQPHPSEITPLTHQHQGLAPATCGPVPLLSYPSDGTKPQFTVPTPARQHTRVVELHQLSAISYNGASLALPAPYHSTIHHICLGALTLPFQEAQGQPCNNTKCHMPWNKPQCFSIDERNWAPSIMVEYTLQHCLWPCAPSIHTQALSPIWGQILSSWT